MLSAFKGVEKVTKVMMILLLVLMIALAVNSVFLPNASEGIKFYLVPDFKSVKQVGIGNAVFAAMSQAFFTLSLGIGAMEIFGSYLDKRKGLQERQLISFCLTHLLRSWQALSLFRLALRSVFNPTQVLRFFSLLFRIYLTV